MTILTEEFKTQFYKASYCEFNDNITRTKLQNMFTNIICNEELNPWDVVDNNSIRFSLDGIVYEFSEKGFEEL